jgi:hypothetical protein
VPVFAATLDGTAEQSQGLQDALAYVLNVPVDGVVITVFDNKKSNTTQFYFVGAYAGRAAQDLLDMTEAQRTALLGLSGLLAMLAPNPLVRPKDDVGAQRSALLSIAAGAVSVNVALVLAALAARRAQLVANGNAAAAIEEILAHPVVSPRTGLFQVVGNDPFELSSSSL